MRRPLRESQPLGARAFGFMLDRHVGSTFTESQGFRLSCRPRMIRLNILSKGEGHEIYKLFEPKVGLLSLFE